MDKKISSIENTVTFNVDKVGLCKKPPSFQSLRAALASQGVPSANTEDSSYREKSQDNIVDCDLPGLMAAVHTAYANHYALKLSVSDFILLIGQGLSRHIEKHAEKLRYHFVTHDGQEKIEIRRDEFVRGQQNDWSTIFGEFADKIKKRVKADVHGVIIDDTSVATPTTRIVSEITLMDAMKSYFSYEASTRCGIPQITLEGTPEDWQKLKDKVAKLVEMNKDNCLELKWWLDSLVPVVEEICEAGIHRKIDVEFWSEIYKEAGKSGGPHITGWITTFFPYLADGSVHYFGRTLTSSIPKQISQVTFIWNYFGDKIKMKFYGGFLGAEFDKETSTLKPAHFWSVNEKSARERRKYFE